MDHLDVMIGVANAVRVEVDPPAKRMVTIFLPIEKARKLMGYLETESAYDPIAGELYEALTRSAVKE